MSRQARARRERAQEHLLKQVYFTGYLLEELPAEVTGGRRAISYAFGRRKSRSKRKRPSR